MFSGSTGSQKTWTGGICQMVGFGPAKTLHEIRNGDTVIWTGPIDISSADGDGKSVLSTTIGTINFYWGTASQAPDPLLEAALLDLGDGPTAVPIPGWPFLIYATGANIAFGQQESPPVLHFELTVEGTGLSLSDHDVSEDALVPEVIYTALTNTVWGLGIPASHIDSTSFAAAAETLITEGLGASPILDDFTTARELIGNLLQYIDGAVYFKNGKIYLKLFRADSTVGLSTITIADMLDEPRPANEGMGETWNVTNINFTDRDNKYETSAEPYDNPANAAALQFNKPKNVSLPFIKRREVAKKLAKLIGVKGGAIPMSWTLQLKPAWASLVPGDRFFVTYAKLDITDRLVRVTHIDRGTPESPEVQVTVIEETTRDTSHDYTPPEDDFFVESKYDDDGFSLDSYWRTAIPRLSWLPEDLKGGKPDGFLVAINRPDSTMSGAKVYWTWDPDTVSYSHVHTITRWPAKGTLLCWHRIRTGNWLLRVQMDTDLDYEMLSELLEEQEVYAVVGQRLVKLVGVTNDEHQVLSPWLKKVPSGYTDLLTDTVIDIEVSGAQFATDDLELETIAADGKHPAKHVYFGLYKEDGEINDFCFVQSSDIKFDQNTGNAPSSGDTELKRYVKTPVFKGEFDQSVADVSAIIYDRDDPTMCADGTYTREGARPESVYEAIDTALGQKAFSQTENTDYPTFQDIDTALSAVVRGTATAFQEAMVEDIDNVFGPMVETSSTAYGDGLDAVTHAADWGARAPTTYELADISFGAKAGQTTDDDYAILADLDEALYAVIRGTETAVQTLLTESLDEVWGAMAESSSLIYNDSP
jgi:hypothetical protein